MGPWRYVFGLSVRLCVRALACSGRVIFRPICRPLLVCAMRDMCLTQQCMVPIPFCYCYPSESASSSKWHAWFSSRCPGWRLSTWPTTAVSCPTALGALCAQLTFRLAWCRQHSAVMATELLQPPDLACGTLFQSSCVIPTAPTDCSDDS